MNEWEEVVGKRNKWQKSTKEKWKKQVIKHTKDVARLFSWKRNVRGERKGSDNTRLRSGEGEKLYI
jgi:cytochrome b subunit of formate dehydrogenase